MEKGEINIFQIEECQVYYEVELWESGDCDSHFFHRKSQAISFFEKHKKHESDCVKLHYADVFGGDCELVKENKQ